MNRIISVGNICLSLFLGMAMISLRLWELQSLALPLIIILASQVLMMALFAYIVAFPLLGRNYDAAVLCAGMCGFGLGATPNAMANMSAVCYKYRYTVKPFLIVPIIGAMFADLLFPDKLIETGFAVGAVAEEGGADSLPVAPAHRKGLADGGKVLAVSTVGKLMTILVAIVGNT